MRRQRQEDQGVKVLFDYIAKPAWVAWDVLSKQNKQTTHENPNKLSNFLQWASGRRMEILSKYLIPCESLGLLLVLQLDTIFTSQS